MRRDILCRMYQIMLKIRLFEEKLIELYPQQEIKCPIHLYIGQEAIAVGVCMNLKRHDYVFSNHRGHGHYIAKGGDLKLLAAELYGKVNGCSKGKGGSMHLVAPEINFLGSSAIVGGSIPLAVGAALASSMQLRKRVSIAFFGDGGVDQGAFHEGLNFASLKRLPVIFVCENNFYATNSPQHARQPLDNIFEKAKSYGIRGIRVDGNNVLAVFTATKEAVARAQDSKGPTLIECRTYRYRAHVGPDCDFETGCRPKAELDKWLKRCPLKRFEQFLLDRGVVSKSALSKTSNKLRQEIEEAIAFGKRSPFPDVKELLEDVY
ncbi:MAG: hypothetical protein AMJ78_06470 [Omnitrophica WOR_2 bacterium SM23_29]|nr:MAG: hypothetical protein AMJ78_06470 [Omnitrophica WOR_2 bacterium SM23_29]